MKTVLIIHLMLNCFLAGMEFEAGKFEYSKLERILGFFLTMIVGVEIYGFGLIVSWIKNVLLWIDGITQIRFYFQSWIGKFDVLNDDLRNKLEFWAKVHARLSAMPKRSWAQSHLMHVIGLLMRKHNFKSQTV